MLSGWEGPLKVTEPQKHGALGAGSPEIVESNFPLKAGSLRVVRTGMYVGRF